MPAQRGRTTPAKVVVRDRRHTGGNGHPGVARAAPGSLASSSKDVSVRVTDRDPVVIGFPSRDRGTGATPRSTHSLRNVPGLGQARRLGMDDRIQRGQRVDGADPFCRTSGNLLFERLPLATPHSVPQRPSRQASGSRQATQRRSGARKHWRTKARDPASRSPFPGTRRLLGSAQGRPVLNDARSRSQATRLRTSLPVPAPPRQGSDDVKAALRARVHRVCRPRSHRRPVRRRPPRRS